MERSPPRLTHGFATIEIEFPQPVSLREIWKPVHWARRYIYNDARPIGVLHSLPRSRANTVVNRILLNSLEI